MKIKSSLMVAIAAGAAGTALAKPPLQMNGEAIRVDPIAVRGVRKLADGSFEYTTDLIPYIPRGVRTNYDLAFDCFEPNELGTPTDGAAFGGYDPVCDIGGTGSGGTTYRWFFGSTYENPLIVNDLETSVGGEGDFCERVEITWYLARDAEFYYILFTADDFSADCAGFDNDGDSWPDDGATNYYSGVQYYFGFMTGPAGYYYSDIDLTGTGLGHQMPADGAGAYRIEMWDDYDFDGFIDPDYDLQAGAQPMLWSTDKDLDCSHQGTIQWDDDAPTDYILDPAECYEYFWSGSCMEINGAMLCFYGTDAGCGDDCPPDYNGDGVLNSQDFVAFLNDFVAGNMNADYNSDGVLNSQDFVAFLNDFVAGC